MGGCVVFCDEVDEEPTEAEISTNAVTTSKIPATGGISTVTDAPNFLITDTVAKVAITNPFANIMAQLTNEQNASLILLVVSVILLLLIGTFVILAIIILKKLNFLERRKSSVAMDVPISTPNAVPSIQIGTVRGRANSANANSGDEIFVRNQWL